MKKIIPAVAMTLLGASLLGTSTYAWFSANTSATVDGLKIKAQASSSLLVSAESGKNFAPTATVEDKTLKDLVDPITKGYVGEGTASTTSQDFKKLDEESKKLVDGDGKIAEGQGTYIASTDDFSKVPVYLLYSGNDEYHTVDAKVTINGSPKTNEEIWNSIRVAFYDKGTATQRGDDFKVTSLGTASAVQNLGEIVSQTELALDVYVWIEGTDAKCANKYALGGSEFSVKLEFSLNTTALD